MRLARMRSMALFARHCIAHQICNDSAFVLAFKDHVECVLDVFRNAEIDGRHSGSLFVENFNKIVMCRTSFVKLASIASAEPFKPNAGHFYA